MSCIALSQLEPLTEVERIGEALPDSDNEARGYRLARLRAALHGRRVDSRMTLKDVANRVEIPLSISQLSRIERGDIDSPSFLDVAAVANVLGLSGNDVFDIVSIGRTQPRTDARLTFILNEVENLPEAEREAFIQVMTHAVVGYRLGEQYDEQQ